MKFKGYYFVLFGVFLLIIVSLWKISFPPSQCHRYSSDRDVHQYVISISLFGPRENPLFTFNQSFILLHQFLSDMIDKYPQWILRVYHDQTLPNDYNILKWISIA